MRHAFFPARKTFMWTILKYYLIVILTLSLALIFYQNFFYQINNTNATNLSRMMELQNFSHGVSAMYDNVQNYVSRNSAEYRENFSNIYKETLPVIEQLQQEYQTSDTYIYRDIRAIFETYYKNGTALMDNADIYRDATFFLTSDLISLEKLMNYLHEEVYLGIEHMLTESNEFVYATLEAQNRTHILLNTAVFIFVILCVIFSWNISRYIAAPISQLSTKFQKVAGGCLQIRAEQERKNCVEINMLIDSFNLMVEKLRKSQDTLIQKQEMELKLQQEHLNKVKMESLLKESELKFLHMQINPHFLFNTLNSILAIAQIEDAEKTSEMISSLSVLLRYTLNTVNEKLPLSSEIKIIENYLFIQKTRFGQRLNYRLDIDDDCMNIQIPSMILQPLVENSIIHGLESSENGGNIYISAHLKQQKLEIMVRDDGIGMPSDVLERLNHPDTADDHGNRYSIGISNVQKRLKIMYNENRIEITSAIGKGTCIRILL